MSPSTRKVKPPKEPMMLVEATWLLKHKKLLYYRFLHHYIYSYQDIYANRSYIKSDAHRSKVWDIWPICKIFSKISECKRCNAFMIQLMYNNSTNNRSFATTPYCIQHKLSQSREYQHQSTIFILLDSNMMNKSLYTYIFSSLFFVFGFLLFCFFLFHFLHFFVFSFVLFVLFVFVFFTSKV